MDNELIKEYLDTILKSPNSVFYKLKKTEKDLLREKAIFREYNKNCIIFNENETPNSLICLANGIVKIYKEGVVGRKQIVRLARPGGFIGYRALIANQDYQASAVTIEKSIVCFFPKNMTFKLMKTNADFSFAILRNLAQELGFRNTLIVSLTQKHLRGRLAEALLFLGEEFGYTQKDNALNCSISREDLASLSNMTTSNAIRTLLSFTEEELVELKSKKIVILNKLKLKDISNLG